MEATISALFDRLDNELAAVAKPNEVLDLYLLGGAALVVQFQKPLATKDVDVVGLNQVLESQAKQIIGRNTPNANEIGLYLDVVESGRPPVPHGFQQRCSRVEGKWKNLRVWLLDVHDLAVTKLKRFSPQDRQNIQFLCDLGMLNVKTLTETLQLAFLWSTEKDGDPDYDRARANLVNVVEYAEGRRIAL